MRLDTHGGLDWAELRDAGLDAEHVFDFSANVNPFGPPPAVRAALCDLDPSLYPDRAALGLRERLAVANGVQPENVLVGNGTAELIWLSAHAFLQKGAPAFIVGPTFTEYARASAAVGAAVVEFRAAPPDFALDVDRLASEIEARRPAVTFLCNPNNPTGQWLAVDQVARIAAACGAGLLILDEAYRGFVTFDPFGSHLRSNVIALRSMTKDFALAGLRLGYGLAGPALLAAMRAFQPPWSVSAAAQAAGQAALDDLDHLRRTLRATLEAASELQAALRNRSAAVVASATHFCLIDVGSIGGAVFRRQLLRRGCVIRDCASFGLPQHVRAGTRRPEDNQVLIQAWPRPAVGLAA